MGTYKPTTKTPTSPTLLPTMYPTSNPSKSPSIVYSHYPTISPSFSSSSAQPTPPLSPSAQLSIGFPTKLNDGIAQENIANATKKSSDLVVNTSAKSFDAGVIIVTLMGSILCLICVVSIFCVYKAEGKNLMPDDNVGQKDDKVANSKEHVKKENVVRIDSVSAVGKDMNSPTQSIATPQSAEFNIEDDNERYAHTPKGKDRIGK